MGDILRRVSIKLAAGISAAEGFSMVLTDRIIGLLGMVVVDFSGLLLGWKRFFDAG